MVRSIIKILLNFWSPFLLCAFFMCSCAASRYADDIQTYDNIFIGRLIEYNASYELRELTEFKSVDIIIDEIIKGDLSHDTMYYPTNYIESVSALLCLDDEECAHQRVGYFGYFNHDHNGRLTKATEHQNSTKRKNVTAKIPDSKIITSSHGNEIFNYVIVFCNDVFNGYRIRGQDTFKLYDLRFADIEEVSKLDFKRESKKLKKSK